VVHYPKFGLVAEDPFVVHHPRFGLVAEDPCRPSSQVWFGSGGSMSSIIPGLV
jgi:hypothetical protein